ncbi:MAG: alcohol dehydrogenase catalytic domain-containing protein [Armatimonadetes bacterium]|nr:alcohol dehydrogenase catalytic domain-containing protein [Armatimonadota bacterium]MDW8122091.1 alcohol dehydrogenase catalytic domain-containing protein [Armatimonadota bacterium]
MKAILYRDWEDLVVTEVPEPVPNPNEVLIRVGHCGICGSELECVAQRHPRRQPPLILGHEFAGEIVAVGSEVQRLSVGQRVAVHPFVVCRQCRYCRQGKTNLCEKKKLMSMHIAGAFAELVVAPEENCYPLPDGVPTSVGAMAEPVANAVHAVRLAQHILPHRVIVFGAGPIGLVCAQVARLMGALFLAIVEIVPSRLEVARRLADAVINPSSEDLLTAVREMTDGSGFDLAMDAVGKSVTRRQSIEVIKPTGTAVWVGLHDDETQLSGMGVVFGEKTLQGSYAYTEEDFATAVEIVSSARIDVQSWVQEFPLTEGVDIFWRLARGQAPEIVKAILRATPN